MHGLAHLADDQLATHLGHARGTDRLAQRLGTGAVAYVGSRLRQGPVGAAHLGGDVVDILHRDGRGQAAVVEHALAAVFHVLGWDEEVRRHVHVDLWVGELVLAARLAHGLCQQAGEEVEAHGAHVAALLGSHEGARTTYLQILHSDPHAASQLCELADSLQALGGLLREGLVGGEEKVRVGLALGAAHAALELVELRQTQALGILDDEGVGMGVVQTALHDGGSHQDVDLSPVEALHHVLDHGRRHLAVRHADAGLGHGGAHGLLGVLDGAHAVAHIVDLAAALDLAADSLADQVLVPLPHVHLDGAAVGGRRGDEAHVAHAGKAHLQGARDGRGAERKHVDALAQVLELLLVAHAKALLLVDDDEAQLLGVDVAREQAVRAHQDVDLAFGKALERGLLLGLAAKAAEHLHTHPKGREAIAEGGVVLLGQDGGGAQDHHLAVVGDGLEGSAHGHLGLAKAHVSADEAVHGLLAFHVRLDLGDRRCLVWRLLVGEEPLHLHHELAVWAVAVALDGGAARIEIHQVEGELFGGLARLAHRTRPVGRVQAGEARARAVRPHIAGDAVDLLDGHKELVAFCIGQQQVVALEAVDLLAHDVFEERDAVAGVHHVVARLEGEAELGDVHAAAGRAARRARGEVADGEQGQVGVWDDEAGGQVELGDVEEVLAQGLGAAFEALDVAQAAVCEEHLHVLAGLAVCHAEERAVARVRQGGAGGDEPLLAALEAGALDGELDVHAGTHAHHRLQGEALLRAEVELGRRAEEPAELLRAHAGVVGRGRELVIAAGCVVEERARLGQHHQGLGSRMRHGYGGLLAHRGQVALHALEGDPGLELGQVLCHLLVRCGPGLQLACGALGPALRDPKLAGGPDLHAVERADGLAGGGHHAAQAVDLVSPELGAHRRRHPRAEDVHAVTADAEAAGPVEFLEVLVAALEQGTGQLLVLQQLARGAVDHTAAHGDHQGREEAAARRRNAAQQGAGARAHHHGAASRQQADGAGALAQRLVVRRGIAPGQVAALRQHQHLLAPDEGRHAVGKALRRFLTAHHHEHGPRLPREERGHEEGPHRAHKPDARVFARLELGGGRCQRRALQQLALQLIDEHLFLQTRRRAASRGERLSRSSCAAQGSTAP